jgi:ferritin-like metal-binding protein YciE
MKSSEKTLNDLFVEVLKDTYSAESKCSERSAK